MERVYKNDMSDEQKQAISQALRGRKHSEDHKRKIAHSMEKYWENLPYKPNYDSDKNNKTAHEEVYGTDN